MWSFESHLRCLTTVGYNLLTYEMSHKFFEVSSGSANFLQAFLSPTFIVPALETNQGPGNPRVLDSPMITLPAINAVFVAPATA